MTELKPCPFCGGIPELYSYRYGGCWYTVRADHSQCCPMNNRYHQAVNVYRTEAEAIEAWNTRTERTCRNTDDDCYAWFECSECGLHSKLEIMSGGYGIPNYCPNCGAKVVD